MGLVLRNIKNSFRSYRSIYFLLIITQLIAIIILFFVYGIVVSYDLAKKEKQIDQLQIDASFVERVPTAELAEILPEILNDVSGRLDFIYLTGWYEETETGISFHEEYHDGKFSLSKTVFYAGKLSDGRYMTEEEMNNGSKVMIGCNVGEIGDTYNIGGEDYKIIGLVKGGPTINSKKVHIPLQSCNDKIKTRNIALMFNQLPTQSDYDVFVSVLEKYYGNNVEFSDFEPLNVDDIIAYNSVIVIALAIGVVAALDTVLVYNYIMKKRKKQIAIYGIEGATRMHQILINEMEVVIITVMTAVIGVIIFRLAIEKTLMQVYEIGISIFSVKVYGIMLLAYLGCILMGTVVLTLINTRKKSLEMRRG